eukprot:CAMPEP_0115041128 /NCGR_PEP_ID=MMETSP0216-20121206/45322_1 /TAXON_ID=223996 /ORGANISM="Protocruzia adherens, Strain Boccale" /LENGTH=1393 /DNA_ID=CAMNT_0002422665 /DNA_START=89 /DNA_END=4270 /DNA_ORIENTATION=+
MDPNKDESPTKKSETELAALSNTEKNSPNGRGRGILNASLDDSGFGSLDDSRVQILRSSGNHDASLRDDSDEDRSTGGHQESTKNNGSSTSSNNDQDRTTKGRRTSGGFGGAAATATAAVGRRPTGSGDHIRKGPRTRTRYEKQLSRALDYDPDRSGERTVDDEMAALLYEASRIEDDDKMNTNESTSSGDSLRENAQNREESQIQRIRAFVSKFHNYLPSLTSDMNVNKRACNETLDVKANSTNREHQTAREIAYLWFWFFVQHKEFEQAQIVWHTSKDLQKKINIADYTERGKKQLAKDMLNMGYFNTIAFDLALKFNLLDLAKMILAKSTKIAFFTKTMVEILLHAQQLDMLEKIFDKDSLIFHNSSMYLNLFKFLTFKSRESIRKYMKCFELHDLVKLIITLYHTNKKDPKSDIMTVLTWKKSVPNRKIIKILLRSSYSDVAQQSLFRGAINFDIDFRIFYDALAMKKYNFAKFYETFCCVKDGVKRGFNANSPLNSTVIQIEVFRLMQLNDENIIYAIYFFKRVLQVGKLNKVFIKKIRKFLDNIVENEILDKHIFLRVKNPLQLCVNIIELLHGISVSFPQYRQFLNRLVQKYLKVGKLLIERIREESLYKKIFNDRDLENRFLVHVVMNDTELYYDLLNNKYMELYILNIWDPYSKFMQTLPLHFSLPWNILINYTPVKNAYPYVHKLFPNLNSHLRMRYALWIKSAYMRKVLEFIFVTAAVIYLCLNMLENLNLIDEEKDAKNTGKEERAKELRDDIKAQHRNFEYGIFGYIMLTLVISIINSAIYRLKSSKKILTTDIATICNYIMVAITLYYWSDVVIYNWNIKNNDEYEPSVWLTTAFLFMLYFQIISKLVMFRRFGPLIQMIFLMLKDVISFLVIDILLIMSFAIVYTMLFAMHSDKFNNFSTSLITLVDATFTKYEYDFKDRAAFGTVCLHIFLVFNAILMVNLLIAILSNTYSKFSERADVEYNKILYDLSYFNEYNSRYGFLIVYPFFLSPITVLVWPVLLFSKSKQLLETLNQFLVFVCYQMFYIPMLCILFIVMNLVLILFAYIKIIYKLLRGEPKDPLCKRIFNCLTFSVLGIFILLYHICWYNMRSYVRSLLTPHRVVEETAEIDLISLKTATQLSKELKKTADSIEYNEFLDKLIKQIKEVRMNKIKVEIEDIRVDSEDIVAPKRKPEKNDGNDEDLNASGKNNMSSFSHLNESSNADEESVEEENRSLIQRSSNKKVTFSQRLDPNANVGDRRGTFFSANQNLFLPLLGRGKSTTLKEAEIKSIEKRGAKRRFPLFYHAVKLAQNTRGFLEEVTRENLHKIFSKFAFVEEETSIKKFHLARFLTILSQHKNLEQVEDAGEIYVKGFIAYDYASIAQVLKAFRTKGNILNEKK